MQKKQETESVIVRLQPENKYIDRLKGPSDERKSIDNHLIKPEKVPCGTDNLDIANFYNANDANTKHVTPSRSQAEMSDYQRQKLEKLNENNNTGNNILTLFRKSKAYAIALGFTEIAELVGIGFQIALYFREEQGETLQGDGELS